MTDRTMEIAVGGLSLAGTLVEPKAGFPGVLFVHGWAGSQERDTARAKQLAQLGCVCLTFDLRGHGETSHRLQTVTREENLADVCAAYDALASHPNIDSSCIAIVGSSYGGYLAALLTALRPVRWLALRVPALYRDEDWSTPKFSLDRADLATYRRTIISGEKNRALTECQNFSGDVLIVESEKDEIVPHPAVASYLSSFVRAHSVTYRVIEGADHALSDEESQQAYNMLLSHWFREMIFGAR